MLKATALARLRLNCQPASDPTLTEQELDDILAYYALEDELGLAPDDPLWAGAWDLPAAYRKAWLVKAGKVVADIDYDVDGAKYTMSQMHAHCLAMSQSFGHVGVFSVGVE